MLDLDNSTFSESQPLYGTVCPNLRLSGEGQEDRSCLRPEVCFGGGGGAQVVTKAVGKVPPQVLPVANCVPSVINPPPPAAGDYPPTAAPTVDEGCAHKGLNGPGPGDPPSPPRVLSDGWCRRGRPTVSSGMVTAGAKWVRLRGMLGPADRR